MPSAIASELDRGDVRIAGVGCSVPNPLAMARTDYQAYVHRDDGWWRSDRLVTTLEHHHCDSDVDIVIEPTIVHVATTVDCQLAEQSETLDYLVAIDVVAPSATMPLIVGEHVVPKSAGGEAFDATLDERWLDATTLSLDGPTSWRDADVENDGATMTYFESEAPSPAGIWNISRSTSAR